VSFRIGVNKLNLKFTFKNRDNKFEQKIEYLEIPVDFKQTLFNKKISIDLIAGFSYLHLFNQSIYAKDGSDVSNSFQENSNVSMHIGLGFSTKIFKSLNFNIEPMLKYHFNPTQNQLKSQTFQISIISGFEYKF